MNFRKDYKNDYISEQKSKGECTWVLFIVGRKNFKLFICSLSESQVGSGVKESIQLTCKLDSIEYIMFRGVESDLAPNFVLSDGRKCPTSLARNHGNSWCPGVDGGGRTPVCKEASYGQREPHSLSLSLLPPAAT